MRIELPASVSNSSAADLRQKGFSIFEIGLGLDLIKTYNRKDFYKICIVSGSSLIHYADRGIKVEGSSLFFGNPHIPYSWEVVQESKTGYTILFTEEFLKINGRSQSLQESPLFKIGGTPVFTLSQQQTNYLNDVCKRMISEQDGEYIFKDDLIRNYINLIIHEALKTRPLDSFFPQKDASLRIASLFIELLERQFPIESKERCLQLKTAHDYAGKLSIHVNHLNRSVKKATGKPTTVHIAERVVTEARSLLQYTDWTVAQIAHALGFESPTYFNKVFKRITGTVPSSLRS